MQMSYCNCVFSCFITITCVTINVPKRAVLEMLFKSISQLGLDQGQGWVVSKCQVLVIFMAKQSNSKCIGEFSLDILVLAILSSKNLATFRFCELNIRSLIYFKSRVHLIHTILWICKFHQVRFCKPTKWLSRSQSLLGFEPATVRTKSLTTCSQLTRSLGHTPASIQTSV